MLQRCLTLAKKSAKLVTYFWWPGPRWISWATEALLINTGLVASHRAYRPLDRHGNPLPWYTYPAIDYLKGLDFRDKHIFEYGSGNSSFFWSERAASVTSVEHDKAWFGQMSQKLSPNQKLLLCEDRAAYPAVLPAQNRKFDLIVIDGEMRRHCAKIAPQFLQDDGLIIFDNSDWWPNSTAELRAAGLIQVDFTGFGPINRHTWSTSLFLQRHVRITPREDRLPLPGDDAVLDHHKDD